MSVLNYIIIAIFVIAQSTTAWWLLAGRVDGFLWAGVQLTVFSANYGMVAGWALNSERSWQRR